MIDTKLTGERIRYECKRKGITVKQIQNVLNIGAFQSIYDWFSGKSLPSLENFYELSKLLKIKMEYLIIEKDFKCLNVDFCLNEYNILIECNMSHTFLVYRYLVT